jgi:hypothetical protein
MFTHWTNTLAYYGICTLRICNVFMLQAPSMTIKILMVKEVFFICPRSILQKEQNFPSLWFERWSIDRCRVNWSTCHFVNLTFSQLAIFSTSHFVNLPLCQLAILSTCHFVKLTFCQTDILSTCHFVNLPFCQLAILSTCYFVNLPFNQLAI